MLDAADKQEVHKRLKRIAGQVAGIERMVDEDRYCIDIVMQVSAVRAALAKVSTAVLERHFETCLADAFETGSAAEQRKKIDELLELFSRHGNA